MTPAGHLLSGYLAGEWLAQWAQDRRERFWIVGAGVLGGIAPDFDVVLGLAGGYAGAGLHRSFSHSLLGAFLVAGLMWAAVRPRRAIIFAAGLGGLLSHIFWDAWNFWSVQLLWPLSWSPKWNLIHEGDLYALGIVALAAVLVWKNCRWAAAAVLILLVPSYLIVQLRWRDHARELARRELVGRRAEVYPTGRLRCGWTALSAGEADLRVYCVTSPWTACLEPVFSAPIRDDFFTRASRRSNAVQEFVAKTPFPFAEETPAADGGAVVIWRDLREAYQQKPGAVPTGIHVRLDAAGRILSERHQWWLSVW